jgi:hypothetical protein
MMVKSAGGSEREQPKIDATSDSKKRRCARRKIRRAHPESDIVVESTYFAGDVSGAGGGFDAPKEMEDRTFFGAGVTGWGATGGAVIDEGCVCFSLTFFKKSTVSVFLLFRLSCE